MPYPLKPGFHFNYDRTLRPPLYEMAAAEAYTEFYGISYMISGERLIYSPNFTTITQAGDLSFIPLNVYRRTTYISKNSYERILIKFTPDMIDEIVSVIGKETFNQLFNEHILHFYPETQKKIMSILLEMEKEWNYYNKYSEIILKGLLNKLIIICVTERIISDSNILKLKKHNTYLANAIKYIKEHLKDNPTINETAENVGISASYLSKIFVNNLHTPYSVFILNEKISYARNLLLNSKLSMTEIAEEAGFGSSSYFSDCFKREMGITPLAFRKQA